MINRSQRISRRGFAVGGGLSLVSLALLSACGGGNGQASSSSATAASTATAASGGSPATATAASGGGSATATSVPSPTAASSSAGSAGNGSATARVGWSEPVPGPDPATDVSYPGIFINYNVYDRLVDYDWDQSKIVPMLATKWDSSSDYMTWTFNLNPDAKFPSGRSVTADDVKWSLNRTLTINDPTNGAFLRTAIDEHSVTAVDDHTVQIKLAKRYAGFLALLTMPATSVIDQKLVLPNVQNNDNGQAWLRQHSAGSGPFVLEQWVRGQRLNMKRNDAYWGTKAKASGFDILVVKEAAQQSMMLGGGDLDIAVTLTPQQLKSLQNSKGFHVATGTALAPNYLGMNMKMKPFDDARVRQAVRLSLDNESTIQDLLGGDATPIGGIIAPGLIGYDPSLVVKRDLPQAKKLLAEAGHPDGFSVPMRFQSGAVLGVGIPQSDLAAKVQADLAEAGIKLQLIEQDPATLLPFYRAGKSPLTMWYWGPGYPDPDPIISQHGDQNTVGSQRLGFEDDEITKLIEDARAEFDPAKRAELYKQAQKLTAERGPYAFMFVPKVLQGISDKVDGYKILPIFNARMAPVSVS